jgi:hypothetical protein
MRCHYYGYGDHLPLGELLPLNPSHPVLKMNSLRKSRGWGIPADGVVGQVDLRKVECLQEFATTTGVRTPHHLTFRALLPRPAPVKK